MLISKFHCTLPYHYSDIPSIIHSRRRVGFKNMLIIIMQSLLRCFNVSSKAYCCYFDSQILHYLIKTGQSFQRSIWYPSSCNIIFHKSMNGCGEYPRSVCLFGSTILWCCYVKASSPFLFSFEGYQENLK